MNCFRITAFVLLAALGMRAEARQVPVEDFFKDAAFTDVTLSPTGEYMTVSMPKEDRTVLGVFRIADMKVVSSWDMGKKRHVDQVIWVNDERFFMYVSEKGGWFDRRKLAGDVYAANFDGSRKATIPNGAYYGIVDTLDSDEDKILVARSFESTVLSKMDVDDGAITTVARAPLYTGSFLVDHDGALRYAVGMSEEREVIVLRRDADVWTELSRTPETQTERVPRWFSADNNRVYYSVSENGEPEKLVLLDPESGEEVLVSSNPNVDPTRRLWSSDGRDLLAVRYDDGLPAYHFVSKDHPEAQLVAGLVNAFPDHAISVAGISRGGRHVLFGAYSDVDPGAYYLFDRETGRARFLLAGRSWIKPDEMAPTEAIQYTARDGRRIHGYLTVPKGSAGRALPTVLMIHGGPHERDSWGFDRQVQLLANRGYAVLQVNFRGSSGYGSGFGLEGDKHWGTTMIDDMADGVDWAVARGVTDRHRVCAYGASYGGYAALQSVVRYPDKFACTIGYVGVYSLPLMRKDGDIKETDFGMGQLARQLPDSAAEQQAQSPAFNAQRIKVPVMLVHGAKDERVPLSHYKLMKAQLEEAGNPPEVTIVESKEEHGFVNLENNVNLYTQLEAFLDKHIGDGAAGTGEAAE